jgi:hypothetical protein
MLNTKIMVVAVLVTLAACSQPKLAGNPESVRIEAPPPGMSVIYLVRSTMDWSTNASLVLMDGRMVGTTAAGVYYRIEVPPGRHRFAGYAFDQGNITLDTHADKAYFVEQHVQGMFNRAQVMHSSEFLTISDARARELIANIHTMPGREPAGTVTVLPLIPVQ